MELKDYWLTVRRRSRIVVATFVTALVVAGIFTLAATPQYESSTRLFVSTTSESDSSSAYTGNLFATQRVTSYADLVTSRALASQVADRLGDDSDPDELMEAVTASVVPETVNLVLTAVDMDPERARDIAQAYGEELAILVRELETPDGESRAPIRATIVDDAVQTASPVAPQPLRNLALAGVLGLLLGIGLAVARELLDTSLSTSDDIGDVTDAPILGNIATDEAANLAPIEVLSSATPWAEAFRVLRTNMQYVEVDEEQKVIVMTSSLPGEGKTTTAINLALTTAMAGQRVVLVEADLRRPLIAQRLQLDGAVGTTNVLIGKVSLADALQEYGSSGLQVLASGPIPPNPSELLQSHAMETLLTDLRGKFDVIIVDAPPLLPVTDAALVAAQADGAVIVIRHGRTTRDQLQHSIERLEAVDAKALGVVINQAPSRKNRTGYGYGYGYGYGFESEVEVDSKRSRREATARVKAETKAAAKKSGRRRA